MEPWLEAFARANLERSSDTAHDLKTPLNVAVLNLELLRMRLRKLAGGDDEKVMAHTQAIEIELRRMAQIFDAFFILSTPPKGKGGPVPTDLAPLCAAAAAAAGFDGVSPEPPILGRVHEARIRQGFQLFFEGAARFLKAEGRTIEISQGADFRLVMGGTPVSETFDLTKIFKFYYTDPTGNPDISLAAARLVAETYGGGLNASEDRGKVVLRMSIPLGEP